ncbi:MAG: fasciclin domain-containing protein [Prevotella sp.]|nr:fasciclin domain-containing protein [Candidatus Prevotella equi]
MMRNKISSGKRTLMHKGRNTSMHLLAACGLLLGAGMMQSCEKDVLTGQPEWLGNSIYERLQDGIVTNDGQHRTFNYTLRLIDDVKDEAGNSAFKDMLSRTGSKTLFATPDDIFTTWLNGRSYDDLTDQEKKLILKNSMINNAYLVELMSNVSGNPPQEGRCVRRETELSIFDNVQTMTVAEMPVNPFKNEDTDAWKKLVAENQKINIIKDGEAAPMMHFLPDFMKTNNITDDDLVTMSNGHSNSVEESWVSGKKVISAEQTCKNGYIYVIDGVIEGSTNMAEALHQLPNTQMWAKALDRFSCAEEIKGADLVKFRSLFNTQDKLYQKRYFNYSPNHSFLKGGALEADLNAGGVLRLDPGWNRYYVDGLNFHYDGAMMVVPTDEALQKWWEEGGGKDLKSRFGTWENLDHEMLAKLINVNMQESFVASVPSKFNSVLDFTSQRPLGISKEHIKNVVMCCNGIIYIVDEVYAPDTYSTVIYPTELQSTGAYAVTNHALTGFYDATYTSSVDFSPYLTAYDSRFSLIVPFNSTVSGNTSVQKKGKVVRIFDPCTYGMAEQNILEFVFADGKVQGYAFAATEGPTGLEIKYNTSIALKASTVRNRLYDLIDNNIIIENIDDTKEYYRTKSGGYVRAYKNGQNQRIFQGGLQIETGEEIMVPDSCIVDKLKDGGNGITYGVACEDIMKDGTILSGVPQTASKSVYQLISEAAANGEPCNLFLELLSGSDLIKNKELSYECAGEDNYNIAIFDSYNYTVYVPTDEKIQEMINDKVLPTWADYEALQDAADNQDPDAIAKQKVIKERIENFLRYHIQDNTVMMKAGDIKETYETGMLNPVTNRFYTLDVAADANGLTVSGKYVDSKYNAKKCNALTNSSLTNKMAREYWISNKGKSDAELATSSFSSVHLIDGVLLYSADQVKEWDPTPSYARAIRRK